MENLLEQRNVLLLQGPVGGFFRRLQHELEKDGCNVRRIVFNAGDFLFALRSNYEVFRGDLEAWKAHLDSVLAVGEIDVIVLFGDERPIHKVARVVANRHGIPVWSFEEGYVRPSFVTFEPGGNNVNSSVMNTFDPAFEAPLQASAPRLNGTSRRKALADILYHVTLSSSHVLLPKYAADFECSPHGSVGYGRGNLLRRVLSRSKNNALVERFASANALPFFVVALQAQDDSQLCHYGNGWRTLPFVEMVLQSFKRAASSDTNVLIQAHPLDLSHSQLQDGIQKLIEKHGLGDRAFFIQSGPVAPILRRSLGLITINSAVGITALQNNIAVIAFGRAFYIYPGLAIAGHNESDCDGFLRQPPDVDAELRRKFIEHVKGGALLPGDFYCSESWPAVCANVAAILRWAAVSEDLSGPEKRAAALQEAQGKSAKRPRVGVFSDGIWRQRVDVASLLDAEPVRIRRWSVPSQCDFIVGWGHKPSGAPAWRMARENGIPFVALEDGFLRSVRPGPSETRIGWIVDHTGIYYDARRPSDLETYILERADKSASEHSRATEAMRLIQHLRLSKYNHAPMLGSEELGLPRGRDVVVVIDQTFGDASVAGAGADETSFVAMIESAISENPGRTIAVKVHPEAISGAKRGYLAKLTRGRDVVLISSDVNPWALIENALRVYVVSSQFGMEAMLAGVSVTCFGHAAYAGWGLTDDRGKPMMRRSAVVSREAFAGAAYLDYCQWLDPYSGKKIEFEAAVERLAFLRDCFQSNKSTVCVGFPDGSEGSSRRF